MRRPVLPASSTSTGTTASVSTGFRPTLSSNPNANFPQYRPDIADNETAIKLKTSAEISPSKLFEEAPLAVRKLSWPTLREATIMGLFPPRHQWLYDPKVEILICKGDGQSIWSGKDDSIDAGNGFKNEISAFLYNIRGCSGYGQCWCRHQRQSVLHQPKSSRLHLASWAAEKHSKSSEACKMAEIQTWMVVYRLLDKSLKGWMLLMVASRRNRCQRQTNQWHHHQQHWSYQDYNFWTKH